jgi:NTE family protein
VRAVRDIRPTSWPASEPVDEADAPKVGADRVGVVLAGGGERVIAWETGVLAGLTQGGFDARSAGHLMGVSAGALVAARIASGVDPHREAARVATESAPVPDEIRRVVANVVPRVVELVCEEHSEASTTQRRRRAGYFATNVAAAFPVHSHIARQAQHLPDGEWPARLRIVAVDADSGDRIVLTRNAGVPLREAVAGARALPGLVEPIRVAGRRLIDAGIASATNADLLPRSVAVAVILTATAHDAPPHSLDWYWNAELERERVALKSRGIRAVLVRASAAARHAMGDELTSTAGAAESVEHGIAQGMIAAIRLDRTVQFADDDRAVRR